MDHLNFVNSLLTIIIEMMHILFIVQKAGVVWHRKGWWRKIFSNSMEADIY